MNCVNRAISNTLYLRSYLSDKGAITNPPPAVSVSRIIIIGGETKRPIKLPMLSPTDYWYINDRRP